MAGEKTRAGKRERNKAENRAAILAAARRVFVGMGYEAATVRDVIGSTDLAAGTFYNYFRDKESVLRALLGATIGEMHRRTREARRDAVSVADVVGRTLEVSFAMLAEDREVLDLLQRNAGAIRAVLDEPSFVAGLDDLRGDLVRALRREGRTGVDAEFLTAAVSGLALEVAARAVDRGPAGMQAAAAFATSFVLGGLEGLGSRAAKPAPRRPSVPVASRPRASREPAAVVAGNVSNPAASAASNRSRRTVR